MNLAGTYRRPPEMTAFTRVYLRVVLTLALFFTLFQIRGLPLSIGDIAISNAFVAPIVLVLIVDKSLWQRFPRCFIAPVFLLSAMMIMQMVKGTSSSVVFVVQGFFFLLLPYAAWRFGMIELLIRFCFLFVGLSQAYLLINHGGTLPTGDLGGFFVSRRTVHSLSFGVLSILIMPKLRNRRFQVIFFIVVCITLLISQARGAALLFGFTVLAFQGENFSLRLRVVTGVLIVVVVLLSFLLSPDLLLHYQAALSFSGGSSTGYRAYLMQMLITEFDRYWLWGMADSEVQILLANQFTRGKQYINFALDNAFVHFALTYGVIVFLLLIYIAVRLLMTRKAHAVFFVGWLLLDDVMGSALGWFFLGLVLVTAMISDARSEPTHVNFKE